MSDNADKVHLKGRWEFYENIFKLSETKDPDKLPEEWKFIGKAEYSENDGHCVCNNSKVKYAYRFFNIITGSVCICGSVCKKKLKLLTNSSGLNQYLADFLNGSYPSEYTTIKDIYAYSIKQKDHWLKSVLNEVRTDLNKKSLKDIRCLLMLLKEFQSILQKNGVYDCTLDGLVCSVEKRENQIIQYHELQAAMRRKEEEERKKNAAHNAELYRVAYEKCIKEEKEEEIKRLEEEAREKERLSQEAEKQRQEAEKQSILKGQAMLATERRLQAETKCTCGRSLLAEVCKCKHPQFTQRTLFGKTILCSKCSLKKCGCSKTS
jgi:hypothetical protein